MPPLRKIKSWLNRTPVHTDTILFLDRQITVNTKAVKNLRIKIDKHTGETSVVRPIGLSNAVVMGFLRQKQSWLIKQWEMVELARSQVPADKLALWGHYYDFQCTIAETKSGVSFDAGTGFTFYNIEPSDAQYFNKALESFYRRTLKSEIDELLPKVTSRLDLHPSEVRIKKMKTRWGSCNISKKRIWLSLNLITKPKACLELVLVHELAHLLEPGHTKRFYSLMDDFLPNWRDSDQLLQAPSAKCE